MDLLPTSEQQEIVDSIRAFLSEQLPLGRHRGREEPGEAERRLWRDMCALGWVGLGLPEEHGGLGLGLADEALAQREYGRCLVSTSLLATTLAAHLSAHAGQASDVAALLGGERRAALAVSRDAVRVDAHRASGAVLVFDARPDDRVVLWTASGIALFDSAVLEDARPVRSFDDALPAVRAQLSARPLAYAAQGAGPLHSSARILAAAYCTGLLEAVRDMAVAHAATREQFGQPIGAFQAVKHLCADIGVRAEVAWAQTAFAALSVQDRRPDADFQAVAASLYAAGNAVASAEDNIQVHGGMGYTAEIAAHLLLKRAHVMNQLLGAERAQQAAMLQAAAIH